MVGTMTTAGLGDVVVTTRAAKVFLSLSRGAEGGASLRCCFLAIGTQFWEEKIYTQYPLMKNWYHVNT